MAGLQQIQDTYEQALDLPAKEREQFLDQLKQRDPGLYTEVASLLQVSTTEKGLLEVPAVSDLSPTPAADLEPENLLGQHLGPYEIVKELGRGGMGQVYLGVRRDGEVEMKVSIKVVRNHASPQIVARFRRERQLLVDLKHPNIAAFLDAGTTSCDRPYLIMDHIEGSHIDAWNHAANPSLPRLLGLFRKLIGAVGFAHQKGVIHRDIKPGNLMVTPNEEPMLLDFGIAHLIDDGMDKLSQNNQILMTPNYAAPEQRRGAEATIAFDIYAMGLVLLELLTRKSPPQWQGTPVEQISQLILDSQTNLADQADQTQPQVACDTAPEALGHVLRTTLAEDPAHRYPSMDALMADLDRVLAAFPENRPTPEVPVKTWDALFWYHPKDSGQVEALAHQLSRAGFDIWLDLWSAEADADPRPAARQALQHARTCLVCHGPHEPARLWTDDPATKDAVAFRSHGMQVLPLLLPGAEYPRKQSELPAFLRDLTWITIPTAPAAPDTLITRLRDVRHEAPRSHNGICPFRGLEVFREQDREWFFGRDAAVQRLERHLQQNRFIAVLGASGSGKSSLVRAGLIPRLREDQNQIAVFTPTQNPIDELAFYLHALFPDPQLATAAQLTARLQASSSALHYIAAELMQQQAGRLYLVIDQFEEIFTLAQEQASGFVANLTNAMEQPDGLVSVILTMRSDFLGKSIVYPELSTYISDHFQLVEPMNRNDLAHAIEAPARLTGLTLEPGLLDRILDDVAGSSAELPLLEHALLELYQRRDDGRLTQAAYTQIGGLDGALAKRAEDEFAALDSQEQRTLRKMFTLCLIHPGEGVQDTRRRATREELIAIGGASTRILQGWISARLLTAAHDQARSQDMVDVAHEALIRRWERIGDWMAEDRETARRLQELRRRTQVWVDHGYHNDHLLRGGPLYQMKELEEREAEHLAPLERRFIAAGLRQVTRRKWMGVGLGSLGFLLAAIAVILFFNANSAKRAAQAEQLRAEQEQTRAEQQILEANYNLAIGFEQKAEKALQEKRITHAWLYALAALSRNLPSDKSLPRVTGMFADPSMSEAGRLLYSTPLAPDGVCMAVSPDNRLLAVGDRKGKIYLLDLNSGKCKAVMRDHQGAVTDLAFTADSKGLISGGFDQSLRHWPLADHGIEFAQSSQIARSQGHAVQAIAVSPDERLLAVIGAPGAVTLHHLDLNFQDEEYSPPVNLQAGDDTLTTLAFAPDGHSLAAAGPSGVIYEWDLGTLQAQQLRGHQDAVTGLLFLPNGNLISASRDHSIRRWSPNGQTHILHNENSPITAVSLLDKQLIWAASDGHVQYFDLVGNAPGKQLRPIDNGTIIDLTPCGQDLAVLSKSGVMSLHDRTDGQALRQFKGHQSALFAIAVSPQDGRLASVSEDGTLQLWDQSGAHLFTRRGHTDAVMNTDWSPDGRLIATASKDGSVCVWDQSSGALRYTWRGHTDLVWTLAFSPDSNRLACGSADRSISLLDADSGDLITSLTGHEGAVRSLAFSPNGALLASVSADHSLRLWNGVNGAAAATLTGHTATVRTLAFSPDGSRIVTGSDDTTLRLWDVDQLSRIATMEGHGNWVWDVAFSPDGKRIASAGFDSDVRLWDGLNGRPVATLSGHTDRARCVAFSPDGKRLASGSFDRTVRLWDTRQGDPVATLDGHSRMIMDLAFSKDGNRLFSAGFDGLLKTWDVAAPVRTGVLGGHFDRVTDFAVSPDGQRLASVSNYRTLHLWDALSGQPITVKMAHADSVLSVAISPNGQVMATASADHSIRLWDSEGQTPFSPGGHDGPVTRVTFSPRGDLLASASSDRTVKLWDAESGVPQATLRGHQGGVLNLIYSPEGKRLISTADDGGVYLWDGRSGAEIAVLEGHEAAVSGGAFSPDGKLFASVSNDRTLRLWNGVTGAHLSTLIGHSDVVTAAAFSPTDHQLASVSWDRTVRFWSIDPSNGEAREKTTTFNGHTHEVLGLDYSPDGRFLATSSYDKTVRIWNTHTGETMGVFKGHTRPIQNVRFTPDGRRLVSSSSDKTMRLWEMTPYHRFQDIYSRPQELEHLTKSALSHFGYRLDGFELSPQPTVRLERVDHTQTKPPDLPPQPPNPAGLMEWLLQPTLTR